MKSTCLSSKTVILALLVAAYASADSPLRSRLKLNKAEVETVKHM